MKPERIVGQLDKMVATGRITQPEAARLRATEGTPEFDAAIGAVRARHAEEQMVGAIRSGEVTQEEADAYLERLLQGEHPKGLRARLAKHRPRSH
jgi:polyhydroxyalkanoate synthesis regulator phasin